MIDFLIFVFSFLPSFLIHLFLSCGVVLFGVSFFNMIPQKILIRYIGIAVIVLGLYFEGAMAVINEFQEREKEWQYKLEVAEENAKKVNTKIKYVYRDRVIKIKEKHQETQQKIIENADKMDKECKVVDEAVNILNEAATNK